MPLPPHFSSVTQLFAQHSISNDSTAAASTRARQPDAEDAAHQRSNGTATAAPSALLPPHFSSVAQLTGQHASTTASGSVQPPQQSAASPRTAAEVSDDAPAASRAAQAQNDTADRGADATASNPGRQSTVEAASGKDEPRRWSAAALLPAVQSAAPSDSTAERVADAPDHEATPAAQPVGDATEGDLAMPEAPACVICMEPIVHVALGSCGHANTCAQCCLKLRLNYKNTKCSFCQGDQTLVAIVPWYSQLPSPPVATASGRPVDGLFQLYHFKPHWAPGVLVAKTETCARYCSFTTCHFALCRSRSQLA